MPLRISNKGSVVIPETLRQKYNLRPGALVEFVDYGGVLTLSPCHDYPIEAAAGMLAGNTSLTKALLAEHEQERGNE